MHVAAGVEILFPVSVTQSSYCMRDGAVYIPTCVLYGPHPLHIIFVESQESCVVLAHESCVVLAAFEGD